MPIVPCRKLIVDGQKPQIWVPVTGDEIVGRTYDMLTTTFHSYAPLVSRRSLSSLGWCSYSKLPLIISRIICYYLLEVDGVRQTVAYPRPLTAFKKAVHGSSLLTVDITLLCSSLGAHNINYLCSKNASQSDVYFVHPER